MAGFTVLYTNDDDDNDNDRENHATRASAYLYSSSSSSSRRDPLCCVLCVVYVRCIPYNDQNCYIYIHLHTCFLYIEIELLQRSQYLPTHMPSILHAQCDCKCTRLYNIHTYTFYDTYQNSIVIYGACCTHTYAHFIHSTVFRCVSGMPPGKTIHCRSACCRDTDQEGNCRQLA